MIKFPFNPLLIATFFVVSCNTSYKAENVQYSSYRIHQYDAGSKSLTTIVKPYSDSVNKLMNVVIGYNETQLEKKRQGNTLGFFITDAYLEMAKQKIDPKVDAAFMNSGGIRLPEMSAGAITQGKIFELMPFDNLMVLLKLKGSLLKQYLDTLAANEGVIESGINMQIENKTVEKVMVGGKPLELNADYTIVHSDYVAMNSNLLKNINRSTNGYLLRDALLDYVKFINSQNKKVTVTNIDRINYVN
ncbi:MAG TPA: 5'-nucleotidase C-terminal domain-containing protein [Chitinophagaceae bacterium]|nr:5'-nucleotidase C-terminal domain-containing protein [Chitinophagaceae bacterium]